VDPARAFDLLNAVVLPWWAVWLVAPRSELAARMAAHAAVFIALALVYAALLGAALATGEMTGFDFEGIRAGLSSDLGLLAGWTHYLAFDLFAGAWIVREARRLELEPRVFLFFTLMAGPIGLGAFLARRAVRLRGLGQIGETDVA
jgi:hypothetical protein